MEHHSFNVTSCTPARSLWDGLGLEEYWITTFGGAVSPKEVEGVVSEPEVPSQTPSAASALPWELLEQIFLQVIFQSSKFRKSWYAFTAVNRTWSQVALRLELVRLEVQSDLQIKLFIEHIKKVQSAGLSRAPTRLLKINSPKGINPQDVSTLLQLVGPLLRYLKIEDNPRIASLSPVLAFLKESDVAIRSHSIQSERLHLPALRELLLHGELTSEDVVMLTLLSNYAPQIHKLEMKVSYNDLSSTVKALRGGFKHLNRLDLFIRAQGYGRPSRTDKPSKELLQLLKERSISHNIVAYTGEVGWWLT